jgi:hypothetical protein
VNSVAPIWRLLVAGGRELPWSLECEVRRHLVAKWKALPRGGHLVVVHGDCPEGADRYADRWARELQGYGFLVSAEPWPADWDSCAPSCPRRPHRRVKRPGDVHHPGRLPDYCPGAGPRRNAAMVAAGAHRMLAFPWQRSYGTRGCARLAAAASIPVEVIQL